MAREILVKLWCDPCLAQDERVEGRELPPLLLPELTGRRPRVLTLCERHEKEVYTPIVELLEEHGQPVNEEGVPSSSGTLAPSLQPVNCPECGHTSPNRAALAGHARKRHDKTLGEVLGEETPYKCPECEAEGRTYASGRAQGLAAHRRQVHHVVGTSPAAAQKRAATKARQKQVRKAASE